MMVYFYIYLWSNRHQTLISQDVLSPDATDITAMAVDIGPAPLGKRTAGEPPALHSLKQRSIDGEVYPLVNVYITMENHHSLINQR